MLRNQKELDNVNNMAATPSPGQLSSLQIQQMMADAKRMINVRKQALEATGITLPPSMSSMASSASMPPPGVIVPPPIARNMPSMMMMENNNDVVSFDGELIG